MSINYEKAFKKLVEQIKDETKWAEEDYKDRFDGLNKPTKDKTKGSTYGEFDMTMNLYGKERYGAGMKFAYRSIEDLAIKLENGEIFWSEEENNNDGYEDLDGKYEEEVMEDYLNQYPYH